MAFCLPMVRPAALAPEAAADCRGDVGESLARKRDGDEDHQAVDDQQRAVRKIERRQQAGQDGQHERAGDRADVVAAAAEDRRAADRDRRDRGEEEGVAHSEIGLAGIAGEQDPGERRGEARNGVGDDARPQRRHAGKFRHAGARPERIEMAAEGRLGEEHEPRRPRAPPR